MIDRVSRSSCMIGDRRTFDYSPFLGLIQKGTSLAPYNDQALVSQELPKLACGSTNGHGETYCKERPIARRE